MGFKSRRDDIPKEADDVVQANLETLRRDLGLKKIPQDEQALRAALQPELKEASTEAWFLIQETRSGRPVAYDKSQVFQAMAAVSYLKKKDKTGKTGLERVKEQFGEHSQIYIMSRNLVEHFESHIKGKDYERAFGDGPFLARFFGDKELQKMYGQVMERGGKSLELKFIAAYRHNGSRKDKKKVKQNAEAFIAALGPAGFNAKEVTSHADKLQLDRDKALTIAGLIERGQHDLALKVYKLETRKQFDFFIVQNEISWYKPDTTLENIGTTQSPETVDQATKQVVIMQQLETLNRTIQSMIDLLEKSSEDEGGLSADEQRALQKLRRASAVLERVKKKGPKAAKTFFGKVDDKFISSARSSLRRYDIGYVAEVYNYFQGIDRPVKPSEVKKTPLAGLSLDVQELVAGAIIDSE